MYKVKYAFERVRIWFLSSIYLSIIKSIYQTPRRKDVARKLGVVQKISFIPCGMARKMNMYDYAQKIPTRFFFILVVSLHFYQSVCGSVCQLISWCFYLFNYFCSSSILPSFLSLFLTFIYQSLIDSFFLSSFLSILFFSSFG